MNQPCLSSAFHHHVRVGLCAIYSSARISSSGRTWDNGLGWVPRMTNLSYILIVGVMCYCLHGAFVVAVVIVVCCCCCYCCRKQLLQLLLPSLSNWKFRRRSEGYTASTHVIGIDLISFD